MTKHVPHVAGGLGATAMAVGAFGLAGLWWGLVAAGLLMIMWAVLAVAGASDAEAR